MNSAPIKRGKTEAQIFWQGKAQNSSPKLRCTFLARRSAKLIASFSATMVTSLPSFSLSLSLCISLSHRMYLTHNIGSASALPIISSLASYGRPSDQQKTVMARAMDESLGSCSKSGSATSAGPSPSHDRKQALADATETVEQDPSIPPALSVTGQATF